MVPDVDTPKIDTQDGAIGRRVEPHQSTHCTVMNHGGVHHSTQSQIPKGRQGCASRTCISVNKNLKGQSNL